MTDAMVLNVQAYLNRTYGAVSGWVHVEEDGITGWDTIYGLRRATQYELGVSPLASGFGDATTSAFVSKVGKITSTTTNNRLLMIVCGALWCKGIAGGDNNYFLERVPSAPEPAPQFSQIEPPVVYMRTELGLSATPEIDVKLMAWLLSMDACVKIPGGTTAVRDVQRWLNTTYINRRDFAIVPCDGYFSRSVQKALLFAIQYEIGMADGTANGNFGPGTRTGLGGSGVTAANVTPGAVDGAKHWVRLLQASLRFNGYDVPFTGSFDATTSSKISAFQEFMELPSSVTRGTGNYTTWCNLLVSCGDTTIDTKGFDMKSQLNAAKASSAVVNAGFTTVGRYTVGTGKFIAPDEWLAIRDAGLKVFPIHQRYNNALEYMTYDQGYTQGMEAAERSRLLGFPSRRRGRHDRDRALGQGAGLRHVQTHLRASPAVRVRRPRRLTQSPRADHGTHRGLSG